MIFNSIGERRRERETKEDVKEAEQEEEEEAVENVKRANKIVVLSIYYYLRAKSQKNQFCLL